jgi:ABC-type polysaccharide transport system permease subunit
MNPYSPNDISLQESQPNERNEWRQDAHEEPSSLSARIWKFRFHYFLPLPAWLMLFAVSLPPLVLAFLIPFKDVKIHLGVAGSPWAGFEAFRTLFGDDIFRQALANTAAIKLSGALLAGLLGLGLALALHALPWRRLRGALLVLFLVPFFIPSAVLARTILDLLASESTFEQGAAAFTDPSLARLIVMAAALLKTSGIPVALALAAVAFGPANPDAGYARAVFVPALRAVGAFALVQLSGLFTADFDLIYAQAHALIIESLMTVDLYVFRWGFHMMNLSLAGAAWLVQFILHLPLLFAAYFLIRRYLSPSLFVDGRTDTPVRQVSPAWQTAGIAAVSAYALVVGFMLYRIFVRPFLLASEHAGAPGAWLHWPPVVAFLFVAVLTAIGSMVMTVLLAYPLTVRTLPGRGLYKLVLIIFLAAGPMMVPHFMYLRHFVNTLVPLVLLGLFNLAAVFVLKERFNQLYGDRKRLAERTGRGEAHAFVTLFLPAMWRPLVGLGVLQAASLWNSFLIPLIYLSSAEMHPPILLYLRTAFEGGAWGVPFSDPSNLQAAALISLPPVLLLLVFRRFLTADLFLGQSRNH